MTLRDQLEGIIAKMPLHKKVVGVGAGLFLLACLFVPTYRLFGKSRSFSGFEFIFSLPYNHEVAWSVLAVELVAVLVVTALIAYAVKDPK